MAEAVLVPDTTKGKKWESEFIFAGPGDVAMFQSLRGRWYLEPSTLVASGGVAVDPVDTIRQSLNLDLGGPEEKPIEDSSCHVVPCRECK